MTQQIINIGQADKGNGDPLRTAFSKVNANFTEVYDALDFSSVSQSIIPTTTETYDLGSSTHRWGSLYVSENTIFIGDKALSINASGGIEVDGVVIATPGGAQANADWTATSGAAQILNKPEIPSIAGLATEDYVDSAVGAIDIPDVSNFITAEDLPEPVDLSGYALTTDIPDVSSFITAEDLSEPVDLSGYALTTDIPDVSSFITAEDLPAIPSDISDLTDTEGLLGGGSITVGDGTTTSVSNVTEILINGAITEIEPGVVGITVSGSEGLPTVTVPAETGTDYKGLQVAYGGFHSYPNDSNKRNVTKVVIHKPAATTVDITDDSNSDFFQVSGLSGDSVLAMFVIIGDVNGEKPLSDIQAFAEEVIDTVILNGGVEGEFNTVDEMKAAFYANYADLATAVGGLATDFEFYQNYVDALNDGVTTVREGSGAEFTIDKTATTSPISLGNITVGTLDQEFAVTYGFATNVSIGSATDPALKHLYYYDVNDGIKVTRVGFEPGIYNGYTVDSNGTINGDTVSPVTFTVDGVSIELTPNEPGSPGNYDYAVEGIDPLGLVDKIGQTLAVTFGVNATGSYSVTVTDGGSNYLPGHKIKILGSTLGGVDDTNDIIITVDSLTEGAISSVSNTGTPAGTAAQYIAVTGTNYNVGSGFAVFGVYKYETYLDTRNNGSNYVEGDVITLLGSNITNGTSPENDITITVRNISGSGSVNGFDVSGTVPAVWRTNSISDGGNDEYDTGNYIDSSLANQIAYNGGNTVANGVAAFGTGSSYSFVYEDSVFGLFVTGNSSTSIGTSGSGPDSGSTIISGHIYGPNTAEQTFDNAVSFINLVGTPYAGPLITFTRTDYGDEVDEISEGLHITKDDQGWLYNALEDEEHDDDTPTGSLWNNDGWDDFTNVESRTYTPLESIWGGNFANIPGAKMIMLDTTTDKYWAIEFLSWTNNNQGGGASYTRQELDLDSLEVGIRFQDGTRQTTAYVPTNVKLTAPGERRIEEAYGYKQVSVTTRTTTNYSGTLARTSSNFEIFVTRTSELEAVVAPVWNDGASAEFEISLDGGVTYTPASVISFPSTEIWFDIDSNVPIPQVQGDAVSIRITTGGDPVIWWDKDDLPGGSSDFRGAVIDYHAYIPGRGTIVGTIHIVDDDGDENITHTEVSSGSSSLEYSDLWYVTTEGEIKYRQLDGDDRTLKVQWTAKVFYGSEYYDD